jgi:hypothetical protein
MQVSVKEENEIVGYVEVPGLLDCPDVGTAVESTTEAMCASQDLRIVELGSSARPFCFHANAGHVGEGFWPVVVPYLRNLFTLGHDSLAAVFSKLPPGAVGGEGTAVAIGGGVYEDPLGDSPHVWTLADLCDMLQPPPCLAQSAPPGQRASPASTIMLTGTASKGQCVEEEEDALLCAGLVSVSVHPRRASDIPSQLDDLQPTMVVIAAAHHGTPLRCVMLRVFRCVRDPVPPPPPR